MDFSSHFSDPSFEVPRGADFSASLPFFSLRPLLLWQINVVCPFCSTDLSFEVLATWKDGSDTFMYGKFTGNVIGTKDTSYRCFVSHWFLSHVFTNEYDHVVFYYARPMVLFKNNSSCYYSILLEKLGYFLINWHFVINLTYWEGVYVIINTKLRLFYCVKWI